MSTNVYQGFYEKQNLCLGFIIYSLKWNFFSWLVKVNVYESWYLFSVTKTIFVKWRSNTCSTSKINAVKTEGKKKLKMESKTLRERNYQAPWKLKPNSCFLLLLPLLSFSSSWLLQLCVVESPNFSTKLSSSLLWLCK